MKNFFITIKKSIYDQDFYESLLTSSLSSSLWYFVKFSLMLSLVLTVVLSVVVLPTVNRFAQAIPDAATSLFPNDLVLTVQGGVLSANTNGPYALPIPPAFANDLQKEGYEHMVVIDTVDDISVARYNDMHTLLWLARDGYVSQDSHGGLRVNGYGPKMEGTLDKTHWQALVARVQPYLSWISVIIVLAVFLTMFLYLLANIIYLLLGALLVWAVGRFVLHQRWTYGTSYRVALHAFTAPALLGAIILALGWSFGRMPFFTAILMCVVVYFNFKKSEKIEAV